MKKLLLLGGDSLLIPVIKQAKKLGAYTITCDYLPDNIAHQYSDEYVNFSTTAKEEILDWATENNIDGVLTFTDSGALTAAYIAEKLGLPYQCSYAAANILQDKSLFRRFLKDHHFNCPEARGYASYPEAKDELNYFRWPVIVKPVDSAGSKGVTKVNRSEDLEQAIDTALSFSQKHQFIIEEFLEKDTFSSGSEVFAINGKIAFSGVYDQCFDTDAVNPFIPSGEIWPSSLPKERIDEFHSELQRLFSLLGVTTGLFNVEFRVCKDGKLYIMEVSPRAGGNRLAEMLKFATHQDLIDAEVRRALSLDIPQLHEAEYNGHFAILVLHSVKDGIFLDIELNDEVKGNVIDLMVLKQQGDRVNAFAGANALIGTVFLKCDNRNKLTELIEAPAQWVTIKLKQ